MEVFACLFLFFFVCMCVFLLILSLLLFLYLIFIYPFKHSYQNYIFYSGSKFLFYGDIVIFYIQQTSQPMLTCAPWPVLWPVLLFITQLGMQIYLIKVSDLFFPLFFPVCLKDRGQGSTISVSEFLISRTQQHDPFFQRIF